MHNQFKTHKFKHLMLAMGPRDLNSAPYSPVHCSSHSMTSFQSSELTELPVVENSQLFAQRTVRPLWPHVTTDPMIGGEERRERGPCQGSAPSPEHRSDTAPGAGSRGAHGDFSRAPILRAPSTTGPADRPLCPHPLGPGGPGAAVRRPHPTSATARAVADDGPESAAQGPGPPVQCHPPTALRPPTGRRRCGTASRQAPFRRAGGRRSGLQRALHHRRPLGHRACNLGGGVDRAPWLDPSFPQKGLN